MNPTQTTTASTDRREDAGPAVRAFARLLRAHASTTRLLSAELLEEHGLTINDYEALLVLSHADGQRLKRVDISRRLLLTPSGITRLLEGLEAEGLVERESCATDLRVTYAHLTETGALRLQARLSLVRIRWRCRAPEAPALALPDQIGERIAQREVA